jgi:ribose transport system substrate-binding protein
MVRRYASGVACAALVGAVIGGCGSSGTSSTSGSTSAADADVAAARAAVARYSRKPTAFPVDEPLERRPTGKTFGFLQCNTVACGLYSQLLAPTQSLLGYKLKVVKAGASAQELQTAMSAIIESKPDGVILPATDPNQYLNQVKELQAAEIPVAASGVVDPQKYGFDVDFLGNAPDALVGKLLADWAVAHSGGNGEMAFYNIPELSFSALIKKSYGDELRRLCPSCQSRYVDIPVAAIGNTAPSLISSDLQAHPSTKTAVFASAESATGLPAALDAAGIDVSIVGFGPTPAILQYIKQGQWDAAIGVDIPTMVWSQLDALARLSTGQEPTVGEKNGLPPIQFVTEANVPADPSKGFVAYPDFAQRFAKIWAGKAE